MVALSGALGRLAPAPLDSAEPAGEPEYPL